MHALYRLIDGFNDRLGRFVAWFTLGMVLIQFVLVVMRYVFSAGDFLFLSALWWQESVVYLHGALIMGAAGYTFLHNGHVRVDIFYRTASPRSQDWTDLVGSLVFLLPVCWLIWWSAWPNVALSWRNFEGSTETSGIPLKYLLKSTVLVLAVVLALQAISTALKAALRLMDHEVDDPYRNEESLD
jgi:TRAP-type mannitol/chloroaromatic compound transport system permease small subunit